MVENKQKTRQQLTSRSSSQKPPLSAMYLASLSVNMRWLLVMPSMMESAAVVATPSSARLLRGTQKYNIRVLNHSCLSARNCATSRAAAKELKIIATVPFLVGSPSIHALPKPRQAKQSLYLGRMRVTGLVLPAGLADCTSESQSLVLSMASKGSNFHSHPRKPLFLFLFFPPCPRVLPLSLRCAKCWALCKTSCKHLRPGCSKVIAAEIARRWLWRRLERVCEYVIRMATGIMAPSKVRMRKKTSTL